MVENLEGTTNGALKLLKEDSKERRARLARGLHEKQLPP